MKKIKHHASGYALLLIYYLCLYHLICFENFLSMHNLFISVCMHNPIRWRFTLGTVLDKIIPWALSWVHLAQFCISSLSWHAGFELQLLESDTSPIIQFFRLLGRYLVQTVAGSQFPSQILLQLLVSRRHTGRQPFVSIQIKCSKEVLQSDRNTFVRRCLIFLRCVCSSCIVN